MQQKHPAVYCTIEFSKVEFYTDGNFHESFYRRITKNRTDLIKCLLFLNNRYFHFVFIDFLFIYFFLGPKYENSPIFKLFLSRRIFV